ncbi:hypothetical protein COY88_02020 [Candidatus Roizmanbacteria bacterium CG_4_10_14_0_8_um_filter_35_28]|uniref:SpoVT-AbrB domain-containing protein n=1 Tax=Candidatus Roizmanbacteria bacterium CG_4_10_14_0_8_um_filter_35_28 TaxID=1974827 RepID=A0A2M7QGR4_9BACT|nr:MAG: hypothetical protein COY88_02020 [Candidatus Roizmanbacteria bacterium CG_4_10_14_0_8_um_filter_35_28]
MLQTVRITSKRQITIPVKIFDELGMAQGDHLLVEKKDQSLMLTPAEVLVKRLAGVIKTSKPLKDEELEKMIFQSKVKYFRDKYKKNK